MAPSVALVLAGLVLVGCTRSTPIETAQAGVDARSEALTEAQESAAASRAEFCADAQRYIAALDRYGKVFTEESATVGDVRSLGRELDAPHQQVKASAQKAVDAHHDVVEAQAALAAAQADLESARSGSSTTTTSAATPSTSTTLLPAATVDRVRAEQEDLDAAIGSITDATPLAQAGQQVNAAAFALEAAWFRVVSDAGCLDDEQQAQAQVALTGYAAAVQSALKSLGFYQGGVDGIYGPATVEAVKALQSAHGLPVTGYVDAATAAAIESGLVAKGADSAVQAVAATSALQATLKLAGYWSGPIDGQWTQALTDALKSFQSALHVPASGVVDNATMEALRQAISQKGSKPTTTTTTTTPAATSVPAATTEPVTTTTDGAAATGRRSRSADRR